jgi:hypothetical protein
VRRLIVVLVFLAACGSKTPPPGAVGNATPDAGPMPPPAAGCPASWGEIGGGGDCDATVVTSQCNYPEGSCWCGHATPCTGVQLPDDYFTGQPTSWQCNAVPPAVREDGCPGIQPSGACSDDGKQCTYGSCCVTQVACQGGQWVVGMASCPP